MNAIKEYYTVFFQVMKNLSPTITMEVMRDCRVTGNPNIITA